MHTSRRHASLINLTALFDVLAISAGFLGSYLFRFSTGLLPFQGSAPDFGAYAQALLVVIPVHLMVYRTYGLYDVNRRIRRIEEIFQVFKASTFAVLILMSMTFFYRGWSYSRVFLVISWVLTVALVSCARYYLIQWEYHRKKSRKEMTRVLIVGANRQARQIIDWARSNPHYGQEVIGVLAKDPNLVGKHLDDVPILGISDQCVDFIAQVHPDQVVLADPNFTREKITNLVIHCEDRFIEFKVIADVYGLMTRSVDVEYISSVPLLGFRALPLDDPWNRTLKRIFDFAVSTMILSASFPFWFVLAVLIKAQDGGPVFFRQERVGRDQRVFRLWKFRTMAVNAETSTGPVWARPNDSRCTPLGTFLRRWNIDEIPQLINVWKGEMSLVGPRPERPHFVEKFREDIPRYMARHKIKSGLTGWAQVNGLRGNTSIHERLKYDLYYMENWSLLFDVEILFMTLSARGFKNAY